MTVTHETFTTDSHCTCFNHLFFLFLFILHFLFIFRTISRLFFFREREAKDKEWEQKKADRKAEEKKGNRRREKGEGGADQVCCGFLDDVCLSVEKSGNMGDSGRSSLSWVFLVTGALNCGRGRGGTSIVAGRTCLISTPE